MSIKHLYIVRHGETDYNKRGIIQGRNIDSDLNEQGKFQALRFYQMYQYIPFDKVYTSALKRTHQSVDQFIQHNTPWERLEGLDELSWGIYDGQRPRSATRTGIKKILRQWDKGLLHTKAYMGESPNEVAERLAGALHHILNQPNEENILIATHGRSLRLLMCYIFKLPLNRMGDYPHQNLSLYQVDYDTISQEYKLVLQNDTQHLIWFFRLKKQS